jgi:hypothetical protein
MKFPFNLRCYLSLPVFSVMAESCIPDCQTLLAVQTCSIHSILINLKTLVYKAELGFLIIFHKTSDLVSHQRPWLNLTQISSGTIKFNKIFFFFFFKKNQTNKKARTLYRRKSLAFVE